MTNRRKFLVQSGMAVTAVLASKPFNSFANAGASLSISGNSIVLLHSSNFLHEDGFRLLKQTIREAKAGFGNLVLLDTGSNAAQDPVHAEQMIEVMQQLNYDASLPGNVHFGNDLKSKNIPLVASTGNLTTEHQQNNIRSYHIIKRGSFKIGIIGVTADQISDGSFSSLSTMAGRLKSAEGCNLVVCLSSLGYKNNNSVDDLNLARQTRDIDAIIGTSGTRSHQPEVLFNADRHEVLLNHTSADGVKIGKIEFGFDKDMKRNRISFANLQMQHQSPKWRKFKV